MTLAFVEPPFEEFENPTEWADAYWKARFAFIAAGHSERHETYCASVDPENGTRYVFRVQQMHKSSGSSLGSTTGLDLPVFDEVGPAIAYLEAASFPGNIQRCVRKEDGSASWMTAGVAYSKWAGDEDYWSARNKMPDLSHWHPDLGQTGPGVVPCAYCAKKETT